MSGIIVPSGPSVEPVFTGYAPARRLMPGSRSHIDPSKRIVRAAAGAAPAMHAPRGALSPVTEAKPSVQNTHRAATRPRWVVWAWITGAVLGFIILALQMGLSIAYAGRFLPGVSVAGQQLGGLTRPEAQQLLTDQANQARVRFRAGTAAYDLTPAQVGASYDVTATLDQAYTVGHPPYASFMPWELWQSSHHSDLALAYDLDPVAHQALVQQVVDHSGQLPVDATIVVTNGVPAVQADTNGHALSSAAVSTAIAGQLGHPGSVPPTLEPSTQLARIRTADAAGALGQTKQLIATPVTITYQSSSFTPTPAQVGAWITFDPTAAKQAPGLMPKLDPAAIQNYLATIARQINVGAVTQKVNVQNGTATVYQQGQNGLSLDAATLASKIASSLTPNQPLSIAAPTVPVPFQTQYNNSVALPYNQYIEVNLSSQHLWVYQNHTVIYDSPVTSGATGAGFPTATGMFSILSKQTDRHLVGYQYGPAYNYDVFVQYWMQFYEGYGLHDASWRNGNFGGQDYYYGGSHGCVNLPLATAAWLYNWSSIGTPVWVHT